MGTMTTLEIMSPEDLESFMDEWERGEAVFQAEIRDPTWIMKEMREEIVPYVDDDTPIPNAITPVFVEGENGMNGYWYIITGKGTFDDGEHWVLIFNSIDFGTYWDPPDGFTDFAIDVVHINFFRRHGNRIAVASHCYVDEHDHGWLEYHHLFEYEGQYFEFSKQTTPYAKLLARKEDWIGQQHRQLKTTHWPAMPTYPE